MKSESLFLKATFCALAFLVFSFHHQHASLIASGGNGGQFNDGDEQDDPNSNRYHLRSISNKEDQVLKKIEEMNAHLVEIKDSPSSTRRHRQLAASETRGDTSGDSAASSSKEDLLLLKIEEMSAHLAEMKKKDKLLQKMEQMGAQLAEMKQVTDKLTSFTQTQEHTPQSIDPVKKAHVSASVPASTESLGSSVTATSSTTIIENPNDPCHILRKSTFSVAVPTPYAGACKHRFLHELPHQPKPLSIATVIPGLAREKDFEYFPKVLKSLQNQTLASDEIVIAISGVFDRVGIRHKAKLKDDFSPQESKKMTMFCNDALQIFTKTYTRSPIKVICIGERLSSGRARNAAVSATSSDILAFIDSDDTAYPIRNEVIRNIFDDSMLCRQQEEGKPPLLLLLHSHRKATWKSHPYEKSRGYTSPATNKVLPGNLWTGKQCLEQEEGLDIQHGRHLLASMAGRPTSWMISEEVANGHPVIRRRAFDRVHFSSIPKGQDIILLRDLMYTMSPQEAEESVLYIKRPLTTYYSVGNANSDLRNLNAEKKEKDKEAAMRKAGKAKQKEEEKAIIATMKKKKEESQSTTKKGYIKTSTKTGTGSGLFRYVDK